MDCEARALQQLDYPACKVTPHFGCSSRARLCGSRKGGWVWGASQHNVDALRPPHPPTPRGTTTSRVHWPTRLQPQNNNGSYRDLVLPGGRRLEDWPLVRAGLGL